MAQQSPFLSLRDPSAADITSLYLYGATTPPKNLADPALIRPAKAETDVTVDGAHFMKEGGGRFAVGAQFPLVQKFFAPDSAALPEGSYSKQQVAKHFGMENYGFAMRQREFGDGKDDQAERTYIYNSGTFMINDEARFIVGKDGHKRIENFAVQPRGRENFDFESSDTKGQFANEHYLQPNIDPSHIGRKVNIGFSQNIPHSNYDSAAYAQDRTRMQNWQKDDLEHGVKLISSMKNLVDGLWNSGVTKFLDDKGRPVLYADSQGNAPSAMSVMFDPINYPTLHHHVGRSGITVVHPDRIEHKPLLPDMPKMPWQRGQTHYAPLGRDQYTFGTPAPTVPSAIHADNAQDQKPSSRAAQPVAP